MQLESQPSYKTERRNVWTEGSPEVSGSASLLHALMNKVEGDRCCLKMPSGPHMSVVTHNCTHPTENNKRIKTPFIRIYTPVFIYKTQSLKNKNAKSMFCLQLCWIMMLSCVCFLFLNTLRISQVAWLVLNLHCSQE